MIQVRAKAHVDPKRGRRRFFQAAGLSCAQGAAAAVMRLKHQLLMFTTTVLLLVSSIQNLIENWVPAEAAVVPKNCDGQFWTHTHTQADRQNLQHFPAVLRSTGSTGRIAVTVVVLALVLARSTSPSTVVTVYHIYIATI
jgi:hypothetical protein